VPTNRSTVSRVGVFGGTFDPIHIGHLVVASEVAYQLQLDEVVFVPTGEPWQKSLSQVTPAAIRVDMVAAAIAGNPRFSLSLVDVERAGPTFTVDTLTDLAAQRDSSCEFFFIMGADAVQTVGTWRDAQRLGDLATFVAVNRPGHDGVGTREQAVAGSELVGSEPVLQAGPIGVLYVQTPSIDLSSTQCRERVALAAPLTYLIPEAVEAIIVKNGLYGVQLS